MPQKNMKPTNSSHLLFPLQALLALATALASACLPSEGSATDAARAAVSIASTPIKTCSNSCATPSFNGVTVSCSTTNYCISHQNGVSCDQGASGMEQRFCSTCGNYQCDAGESNTTCPTDCAICGDGVCTGTEDWNNCPADCTPEHICGDGICDARERSECPVDCCQGWPCYLE